MMKIERSLEQISGLISECWGLRHNPKELDSSRVRIQELVEKLIEFASNEGSIFPLKEEAVKKISVLVQQFNELECMLQNHKAAIDTVISDAVLSARQ